MSSSQKRTSRCKVVVRVGGGVGCPCEKTRSESFKPSGRLHMFKTRQFRVRIFGDNDCVP